MKTHAIIPIFIPHEGCPNDCVFCNQKKITAKQSPVTPAQVTDTIQTYLSTLRDMDLEALEIAFFGGSFTAIPMEKQCQYLAIAKEYKDKGIVDKIHLSTRPDCIDRKILDNLKAYGVDVIELGVQSFDEDVLKASNRGHDSKVVYESCELVKEYGFTLGIQLMIGLPEDTTEKAIYSAKETVKIAPEIARLYPTVVIEDTKLFEMAKAGTYVPLSQEEAVQRTKIMYQILDDAGINIIRVGLKSSDIISDDGHIAKGTFHPAFRQLVEGQIAREMIEPMIDKILSCHEKSSENSMTIYANSKWISNAAGNGACNRKYWEKKYPLATFSFKVDESLKNKEFRVE